MISSEPSPSPEPTAPAPRRSRAWVAYVAVLHLLLLAAAAALLARPAPPDNFRRQMIGHLARLDRNLPDGTALFLGSSSIQALHVADIAPNAANLGIGAEQIHELHARLTTYTALPRARLIVLAIGYNDLRARPPEAATDAALAAYRALLASLPPEIPLVVNAVQPGAANPLPAATESFNAGLRRLCAARPACAYVQPTPLTYEPDGIHLDPPAYAAWKQALRAAIATLPPRGGA